jgi:maleate isomerase
MAFTSWRGIVGCIKPTLRPGSLEELIRMLPEGVGVIPLFLNIRSGTTDEFKRAVEPYEPHLETLAEQGCDLIHPEGAPPFMLLGYKGETKLIDSWRKKYKTPIFTAGQNHVAAMRALGIKKFVGASYSALQNKIVIDYMKEAGFGIASMEPIEVPFQQAGQISPETLYAHIKRLFLTHKGADGIYIQGGAWRNVSIIETLERDLGVPVVHATLALAWQTQKQLRVNAPLEGYGRLLRELPDVVD